MVKDIFKTVISTSKHTDMSFLLLGLIVRISKQNGQLLLWMVLLIKGMMCALREASQRIVLPPGKFLSIRAEVPQCDHERAGVFLTPTCCPKGQHLLRRPAAG